MQLELEDDMQNISNVNEFDEAVAHGVVLVDFWATWCGPCKMLAPTIESISEEYSDRAEVKKVDVDECPQLAERFGIYSIPTLLFFKDGKEENRMIGYRLKREISAVLDELIK